MPLYSELATKFGKDVQFVAVSTDPDASYPKKFLEDPDAKYGKQFPLTFCVAHDTGAVLHPAYKALCKKIVGMPYMFLVDKDNKIVWSQDHSMGGATAPTWMEQVSEQIAHTVAGEALASNGTKAEEVPDEASSSEEEGADDGADFDPLG
jgi:hypothetical protein